MARQDDLFTLDELLSGGLSEQFIASQPEDIQKQLRAAIAENTKQKGKPQITPSATNPAPAPGTEILKSESETEPTQEEINEKAPPEIRKLAKERIARDKAIAKLEKEREAVEQRRLAEQEAKQQQAQNKFKEALASGRNTGDRLFNALSSGINRLPTPGGIQVPLLILLILFMAIVPVNGHTRLMWLWLTIGGNAKINPSLETGLTATALDVLNTGKGGGEFQTQAQNISTNNPTVNPPDFNSMVIAPEPQFTGHSIGGLDPRSYVDLLGGLIGNE